MAGALADSEIWEKELLTQKRPGSLRAVVLSSAPVSRGYELKGPVLRSNSRETEA